MNRTKLSVFCPRPYERSAHEGAFEMKKLFALILFLPGLTRLPACAEAALLVEEPYGAFGSGVPTGHAAIYLPQVCAVTPTQLRHCNPGELGVVISRYHRVAGRDWLAIPLLPYLYAVDHVEEVPAFADEATVRSLRDEYRRANLFFHNCADFSRKVINFYHPGATHRSLTADLGITTPKQLAKSQASRQLRPHCVRHPAGPRCDRTEPSTAWSA